MRHLGTSALLLGIAALTAVTLACSAASDPADTIDRRMEAWHEQEPERYVVQTCSLGIEPPGCVRAVIDRGEVTAAEERIFDPTAPSWETIEPGRNLLDQMFDRIGEGEQDGCAVDEVQYDEAFGYVQRYTLDCEDSITGGRWVACFEPDAQELDACDVEP